MPKGVYDRSKIKRKTKTTSPKATKVAKIKSGILRAAPKLTFTSDVMDTLHKISMCADIMTKFNNVPEIASPISKMVQKLITELPIEDVTPKGNVVANVPAKHPVSFPAPAKVAEGVKLKKDGTPKARPGPKPKAQTAPVEQPEVAHVSPPNGSSDVFNPEHAS